MDMSKVFTFVMVTVYSHTVYCYTGSLLLVVTTYFSCKEHRIACITVMFPFTL